MNQASLEFNEKQYNVVVGDIVCMKGDPEVCGPVDEIKNGFITIKIADDGNEDDWESRPIKECWLKSVPLSSTGKKFNKSRTKKVGKVQAILDLLEKQPDLKASQVFTILNDEGIGVSVGTCYRQKSEFNKLRKDNK